MTLSLIATCSMLLMATLMTPVTSVESPASNSQGLFTSDFVTFVNADTERADLRAKRLNAIEKLTATYGRPLIWKALQKLWNSEALWSREPGLYFPNNYGLTWIEEVDNVYNYATTFYYENRYSANQWDQSTITAVDIPWEPTRTNYSGWNDDWAHDLSTMLFLTLFGSLALQPLKLNGGERLMYRTIRLCKDILHGATSALERSGFMTQTMNGVELGLIENFITSSMTAGYFYMALPLNVLERSLERMIRTIDSPTDDTQFDPASCLTLLTGGVAGLKDWIPITSCKNLHFTARGVLLMALENFKNLPVNVKNHFENSAVVLLRFKLSANKTLDMYFQEYLWLWNRHYWEHSLAFQYDNFTLNLSEFLTMKTFVFGLDDTGNHYSFNNFASEVDTFMEMTDDWVWNHHLILPNSTDMKETLKALNKADSMKPLEVETVSATFVRRLFRKLIWR